MKIQEIKFNNKNKKYSILIGTNILGVLPKKIKSICPKTKKNAFRETDTLHQQTSDECMIQVELRICKPYYGLE